MENNRNIKKSALRAGFLCSLLGLMANAQAIPTQIDIFCTEAESTSTNPGCPYTGTTNDGTIFEAEANPTTPSTGTGVFKPFVRIQDNTGTQSGYNTDTGEPAINFDTKQSWTYSVLFGDLGTTIIDGLSYYQFSLDSNEAGSPKADPTVIDNKLLIDITEIQIFVGGDDLQYPESNGGYTGTQFDGSSFDNKLAGYDPKWTLDNAINGDVTITLLSSICDTSGQCGSGKGDLNLFILESMFTGSADDYFVFYTEYDQVGSGFEEWRYLAASEDTTVPEPGVLALLGLGLVGISLRKLKKSC